MLSTTPLLLPQHYCIWSLLKFVIKRVDSYCYSAQLRPISFVFLSFYSCTPKHCSILAHRSIVGSLSWFYQILCWKYCMFTKCFSSFVVLTTQVCSVSLSLKTFKWIQFRCCLWIRHSRLWVFCFSCILRSTLSFYQLYFRIILTLYEHLWVFLFPFGWDSVVHCPSLHLFQSLHSQFLFQFLIDSSSSKSID